MLNTQSGNDMKHLVLTALAVVLTPVVAQADVIPASAPVTSSTSSAAAPMHSEDHATTHEWRDARSISVSEACWRLLAV